ncbi:hypothetical protein BSZ39_05300 [Bowdeniella nasicola]|uniref:Uncharacterized protein n=1 Tax=Bowdeniella nasicola TaxID=208480 RepID=A0A1Q5Q2X1_9ACTO|nr:hypothetical protein BSZ39_05300 [Bowdeniella nasicola]
MGSADSLADAETAGEGVVGLPDALFPEQAERASAAAAQTIEARTRAHVMSVTLAESRAARCKAGAREGA